MSQDAARRQKIQVLMDYWIPRLGLADWDITWNIVTTLDGAPLGGGSTACRVYHAGPYQKAHIAFVKQQVDNATTLYERELMVIHELIHIVMHPIQAARQRMMGNDGEVSVSMHWGEEQTTDALAAILYRLRHNAKPTAVYI